MKFSADDFRRRYTDMPDAELLSLDRRELGDIARQCYDVERARRGFEPVAEGPEAPQQQLEPAEEAPAEPEPGLDADADQQEEEELAPAAIFRTRAEAKAARERLQAAFVPPSEKLAQNGASRAASSAEFLSCMAAREGAPLCALLENDDGRFRLLVPGSYLAQAREVLKL